jgi:Anti-sigma factor NepR
VPVALGKGTSKQPMMRQPPPEVSRLPDDGEVGVALRAAYKSALDEAIPPEMLDLLSKLK